MLLILDLEYVVSMFRAITNEINIILGDPPTPSVGNIRLI